MTRVLLPLILPSNISLLPSIIGLCLPVELLMCVFSCPASTKESGLRGRHDGGMSAHAQSYVVVIFGAVV